MFEIAGLKIGVGSKKYCEIRVCDGIVMPIKIPLLVVNGSESGPILCITAGLHGTEYVGVDAAVSLYRKTDPESLRGTLLLVPVANVPIFQARARYISPIDEKDLNSVFPGKLEGTVTELIAHTLFKEIASKAQYALDLHGGDLYEYLLPLSLFFRTGSKSVDEESEALAKVFNAGAGIEFIIERMLKRGIFIGELNKKGIPAIMVETCYCGILDQQLVQTTIDGILNVMKHLKMLLGEAKREEEYKILHKRAAFHANCGGITHLFKRIGDKVSKGNVIGEIISIDGEKEEKIIAPMDGWVIELICIPVVNAGDRLGQIGQL